MLRAVVLALSVLCLSSIASAHGTSQHVLGTVTAIDANHVEVKTQKGATVSVKLTKDTRFKEKGKSKATQPPAVGDRVVIEAMKENQVLTATEVHFSAGKRAATAVAPEQAAPAPAR